MVCTLIKLVNLVQTVTCICWHLLVTSVTCVEVTQIYYIIYNYYLFIFNYTWISFAEMIRIHLSVCSFSVFYALYKHKNNQDFNWVFITKNDWV